MKGYFNMDKQKIDRINELARKSKSPAGLTADEKSEQAALRLEYRSAVKKNLENQLNNIEFVDKEPKK